tara:strand:+ start:384 stop:911 length:528 start_codon:yes stop_codon:yes gene_type:complete
MVQFEYNGVMKRYDVKVPFVLADEKDMVMVASISEENKITLHREISLKLLKQIILRWDEYEHQMSRELDEMFPIQECKHHMDAETCIFCVGMNTNISREILKQKRRENNMPKIIRTLVCPDGVTGLNGWQYLLTDDGEEMEFDSKASANSFLLDEGGYEQEHIDEWIEIIEKGDK